jgi:hypothetical protein
MILGSAGAVLPSAVARTRQRVVAVEQRVAKARQHIVGRCRRLRTTEGLELWLKLG